MWYVWLSRRGGPPSARIPFYYYGKAAFLAWCFLPQTKARHTSSNSLSFSLFLSLTLGFQFRRETASPNRVMMMIVVMMIMTRRAQS